MRRLAFVVLCAILAGCGVEGPPGPQGEKGDVGQIGPQGPQGAPGIALSKQYICSGYIQVDATAIRVSHSFYMFADGSILVTCEADDADNQSTSMVWYKASQPNGAFGQCKVVLDVGSPVAGEFITFAADNVPTGPNEPLVRILRSHALYNGAYNSGNSWGAYADLACSDS